MLLCNISLFSQGYNIRISEILYTENNKISERHVCANTMIKKEGNKIVCYANNTEFFRFYICKDGADEEGILMIGDMFTNGNLSEDMIVFIRKHNELYYFDFVLSETQHMLMFTDYNFEK